MSTTTIEQVSFERQNVHALLAANPNYFGTVPDKGFQVQLEKSGDTTFEGLTCVSFSPERNRLEATVEIRRTTGYSGGLCTKGSQEFVRFYVSYDESGSWTDAGLSSVGVHDIAAGKSCDSAWPPFTYVCGLDYTPKRNWCGFPVLPLVRAILSWSIVPDPNTPDQKPVWGEVRECHVQVKPRRFIFKDIISELPKEILTKIPPYVLEEVPPPIPDPGPLKPLALQELVELYEKREVPPHRFALPQVAHPRTTALSYLEAAQAAQKVKIDLIAVLKALEETKGNVTYEELECVGLDNNADQLVGTFRVKEPNGYSGGPCTAGSTEYVAYWADFGDTCTYSYLGTVQVQTHDYAKLPKGGLCYAAPLPVDCPFAGVVTLHGPLDPALAGQLYRVRVRNLTAGGPVTDLTDPFFVVNWLGIGSWVTPGAGGWSPWPTWSANTTGKLGHFTPGGDDLWEVQLETAVVVDVRRVQMDNTLIASIVADPDNGADLQLATAGACRVPAGPVNGTFVARDEHFLSWSIDVAGGPGTPIPATPVTTALSTTQQTGAGGQAFTIDLSLLDPCGYVVRLGVSDRAVVNSASVGRTVYIERGVCLD